MAWGIERLPSSTATTLCTLYHVQDLSSYSHATISSLVLTADRSALLRCDKEPDGAPTSLAGTWKDLEEEEEKKAMDKQDTSERQPKRRAEATGFGYMDIIEATQDVEGLTYHPRTAETRQVYELILSSVHQSLGDQAHDVIRSAADTVLETLKNENMKDFDKKEVEEVVGPISSETFSQLLNLSKKITDHGAEDKMQVDPHLERKNAEIDEEMGVAVVFNEEEEGFEIRDESDEENEEAEEMEEAPPSHSKEMRNSLLGCQISDVYPDPVTATEEAAAILSILGSESNL
ncbi:hypothetical protein WOLCODRAFT_159573 [Wolfiporia cocos MD-104 SS10]|uniref:Pre-mRNA-splicing helicase BRR2-like plug domain-containing protein n=1 Tax=Wolfiporia cocos (strain MD-104) TaxID=742152 RepID=A0A2H3JA54_WOLCO|nr:hypothetical protein WOLCODRAFT_159573 [Wolfiporia cocos MD-104 SS10]